MQGGRERKCEKCCWHLFEPHFVPNFIYLRSASKRLALSMRREEVGGPAAGPRSPPRRHSVPVSVAPSAAPFKDAPDSACCSDQHARAPQPLSPAGKSCTAGKE
ncbi:hypothetical protein E2C01_085315 [Portunus trituberculatus]|uniref:Uncharacterized protein n=1 Tax=Portunus trituberculatus TaxID=210409 RepID=A0A5B7J8J1_PORTR|nr:hypothetical protein [Portunus trituberculatus]